MEKLLTTAEEKQMGGEIGQKFAEYEVGFTALLQSFRTMGFDETVGLQGALRKAVQMVFQNPYGSLNPRKKIGAILEAPLEINTELPRSERADQARAMLAKA